jgi:hypothetical protein
MIIRNTDLASPEKFISDNLTHKPSVATSAFDNLAAGIATPQYAVNSFDEEYSKSPRGQTVAATFEALKRGNENPEVGWVQWGVNETSNMIGQSLNPLSWALGEVGGLVVRPLAAVGAKFAPSVFKKPVSEIFGEKMGKYFPKTVGKDEAEQTLSLGLLGKDWVKGFGIGAGVTLPQATIDNFNAETGKHDILGMAEGMGAGGAFGMMLGTVPFAWGILKSNINRLRGKPLNSPVTPSDAAQALADGNISKEDYDLLKNVQNYVENPESREALKAGTYYRGSKDENFEYGKMENATLGKGYWVTPHLETAKGHGKYIEEINGKFNIYNVETGSNKELNDLYSKLHFTSKGEKRTKLLSEFHALAKKEGYEGFQRTGEIMLFEKPKNVKPLLEQTTKYVASQGHVVDHANNKAQFEILNRQQIDNLQSATVDQLVADHIPEEHRTALSDFTVQAGIDEMRNKPNLLDGVRGYVEYADQNLLNRDAILEAADKMVDEHFLLSGELAPLDQKMIFEVLKKHGSNSELPFYVPDNVRELARKNEREFKKYIKEIDHKFERLDTGDNLTQHEFYHGTGKLENIDEFDITRAAQHNLYGAGLYITDSKKVASGYAKSRSKPSRTPDGKILSLKFKKNPKLIDVEHSPNKNVFNIIKEQAESFSDVSIAKEMQNKPIKDIFEIIKSEIEDEHDYGWQEIYSELLDHINFTLSEKGYDGYLHTGGKIVGKRDHNVIVLFGHDYSLNGKNYKRNPSEKLTQTEIDLHKDFEDKYSSLKEAIKSIKNPVEELNDIKSKLLPLRDDFRRTKEYRRLEDLADVWHPAKTLLDRVELEDQLNRQGAYRDLAKQMLDIADSNVAKLADRSKTTNYLEARITPVVDSNHSPRTELIEAVSKRDIPSDAEALLAEHDVKLQEMNVENVSKEYEIAKERFKEFQSQEGIFKNFINCVLGSQK